MHRIDGPGATADNRFTEGDPVAGTPATVVTDDFMNAVQEELIGILSAAGVTPAKASQDQVLQAIYKLVQSQKATAFATAGTATALTLTPVPAISAYAANQRFSVKFSVASGANPTLNVSAQGGKSLKRYDASGAKVAATFAAGQISDVVYDGTDMIVLNQVASAAQATEAAAGIVQLASQPEAVAGTESTKALSSIRVHQAISARLAAEYSAQYAIAPGSLFAINHSKGIDASVEFVFVCLTADAGYSPGDEMEMKDWRYTPFNQLTNFGVFITSRTATSFVMAMANGTTWAMPHKTTTVQTAMTVARWAIKARIKP